MKQIVLLAIIIFSGSVLLSQTFTDIAASAGVDGGEGWQGVSFADFDNDGDDDIFIVSHEGPPGALYLNNGDGTFTNITSAAGLSAVENEGGVFGDYDNDGLLDLYVSNEGKPNFLFHNNGDGTFTDVSKESGANHSGLAISSPFGDYNNDGFLDIYVVNLSGPNILFRNNGDGTFTNVTESAGVGDRGSGITAVWSDFNLDGKLDLFVANQNANLLYRNNGHGMFEDITASAGILPEGTSEGAASADLDNDGDIDIYVTNNGSNDILYRNNGDGTFADISSSAGIANAGPSLGIAIGDLDNDGWQDVFIVNANDANVLYHNNGDGTFTDIAAAAGVEDSLGEGQGTAFGDVDNDGDLDIFITNLNLQNRLYINGGSANNWINVNLTGQVSNKFGIGARVKVKSGGMWQTREVDGGSGFSSQNSIPLEFGLGTSATADSVIVYWSSGLISVLTDQSANGEINISEPIRGLDVEMSRMISPELPDLIVSGTALEVAAFISNKGSADASNFDISCDIADSNNFIIYSATVVVSFLAGSDTMSVSFPDWIPGDEAEYKFTFVNHLSGDEYSANDTAVIFGKVFFEKPPLITSHSPRDSTVGVSMTNQKIRVKFSEIMDSSSFDTTTVIVTGSVSGAIPGEIVYRESFNSLSYIRPSDFTYEPGETVTVTLTGGIKSKLGLKLDGNGNGVAEGSPTDDYVWVFVIREPTSVGHEDQEVRSYKLNQNYPNPFNPSTTISYAIPKSGLVLLKVYNILGQEVATLVNEIQKQGIHRINFDAGKLASGVYTYRIKSGNFTATRKFILLK